MERYRINDRRRAVESGMYYIYQIACDEKSFEEWGHDLLCCFCCVATTSADPGLRRLARKMGKERAVRWREGHSEVPADADAETIAHLVFGSDAADRLGVRDEGMRRRIRRAAKLFTAKEYYSFDPSIEPPPDNVPGYCDCGLYNSRGRKICRRCRSELQTISRYGVWIDALTRSYVGERYGVRLGAPFADVIKWVPHMRPYQGRDDNNPDFYDAVYAVTHIVYTLNDYSKYKLSPKFLSEEFEFLKANMKEAIATEDPEMMGEFLDSMRAFGLDETDPLIQKGVDFLLAEQNPDGSWGETSLEDVYGNYHPTWTAVDGLREYRWRREGLSFPELKPMLREWSKAV
jgi:hypothetical protein